MRTALRSAVAALALAAIGAAAGASPPLPGSIAFVRGARADTGALVTAQSDGTGARVLVRGQLRDPRWSPDGTRLAFTRVGSPRGVRLGEAIHVLDRSRRIRRVTSGDSSHPTWSPDGTRIAFSRTGAIWIVNARGGAPRRVTDTLAGALWPDWSPDGSRLVYQSIGIHVIAVDGRGHRELTRGALDFFPAWSPDGRLIAFSRGEAVTLPSPSLTTSIYVMRADGSRVRRLTKAASAMDAWPRWSPDGRRIVFVRSKVGATGRLAPGDLFTVGVDGRGERRLTRTAAAESTPDWRRR